MLDYFSCLRSGRILTGGDGVLGKDSECLSQENDMSGARKQSFWPGMLRRLSMKSLRASSGQPASKQRKTVFSSN
jgi:hypothetical protein